MSFEDDGKWYDPIDGIMFFIIVGAMIIFAIQQYCEDAKKIKEECKSDVSCELTNQ
jgi:hypothetical protein